MVSLTRIIDTNAIDMLDAQIVSELNIDLRRMDKMKHEKALEGVDSFRVVIKPSRVTYRLGLHRFVFEIQYGNMVDNQFNPKGESFHYQTETLPML